MFAAASVALFMLENEARVRLNAGRTRPTCDDCYNPKSDKDQQHSETKGFTFAVLLEILREDDPLTMWTADP